MTKSSNCNFRSIFILTLFVIRIPAICRLENQQKIMGEAVFLVTLYELAYPNKQAEVARNMGLIVSSGQPLVSRIITYGMNHMLQRWLHLIMSEGGDHGALAMWGSSAESIVNCVQRKHDQQADERFDSVGMFIDGAFNFCCRPDQREDHFAAGQDTQRAVYSGYYGGEKFRHLILLLATQLTNWQVMASSTCTAYGAMVLSPRFGDP